MGVFGDPVGVVGSLLYFLLRLLLMGGVGLRRERERRKEGEEEDND